MAASTIIDESYLPRIREALANLDTLEKELELAQRAGLNLAPGGASIPAMIQQLEAQRTLFRQILQVYFPGM